MLRGSVAVHQAVRLGGSVGSVGNLSLRCKSRLIWVNSRCILSHGLVGMLYLLYLVLLRVLLVLWVLSSVCMLLWVMAPAGNWHWHRSDRDRPRGDCTWVWGIIGLDACALAFARVRKHGWQQRQRRNCQVLLSAGKATKDSLSKRPFGTLGGLDFEGGA